LYAEVVVRFLFVVPAGVPVVPVVGCGGGTVPVGLA
jgi:hypothetical protein